jgi:hypothetical protein
MDNEIFKLLLMVVERDSFDRFIDSVDDSYGTDFHKVLRKGFIRVQLNKIGIESGVTYKNIAHIIYNFEGGVELLYHLLLAEKEL